MNSMTWEWYHTALNIGYVLMFIGLALKDILWLRVSLVAAQIFLVGYAVLTQNHSVAFWNMLFISINAVHIIKIAKERRPIKIPLELKDIYANKFNTMTTREFLYFWQLGNHNSSVDETIIKDSSFQTEISLIVSGQVSIIKDKETMAELSRGRFIGEMSFLSGKPASANVVAKDQVDYISWDQEKLKHLETINPQLLNKFYGILGNELADKIRNTSSKVHNQPH